MHKQIHPKMKNGKPCCRYNTDCRYYKLHRVDGWYCDIIGKPGSEACMPWWENRVEVLEGLVSKLKWVSAESI